MVTRILTTALFMLLFFVNASAQAQGDLLKWSSGRKLTWQDYLAEPDSRSGAAASTSTQVGFEYHVRDNKLTYDITCKFSRVKSWGRYKNDHILSHEQGHFDITELFTRKLVQALRQYSFNKDSYRNDLRKIYMDIMKEKERFQQDYDRETDYSRIKEQQTAWLKKIDRELAGLSEFADYQ